MTTNHNIRLHAVDALRGFAIVSIMLLHNIEHFDFYYSPANFPQWLIATDKVIWDTLFFLFGGKSYAIFALLFGLTFHIQSTKQWQNGKSFGPRFVWRLLLLLGFGLINSAFYQGDILTTYALIGFFLVPVERFNTKLLLSIAILLMLQPYEWFVFIKNLNNPDVALANPISWAYFAKMGDYVTGESFSATVYGNLTNGKIAVLNWTWESGRVFQTLSLFILGMIAGRKSLFLQNADNLKLWYRVLIVASIVFAVLYFSKSHIGIALEIESLQRPMSTILNSWTNMAFMGVLLSSFMLLFYQRTANKVLMIFSPIGRMSLTNYILQSILGSFIYYGFGLGLYEYTGATFSLFIGLILALFQGVFSAWWLKNHKQGPLESIWHKLTWL